MSAISEELRLEIGQFTASLQTAVSSAQTALTSLNSMDGSGFLKAGPNAARNFEAANKAAAASVRATSSAIQSGNVSTEGMASRMMKAATTAGQVAGGITAIAAAAPILARAARSAATMVQQLRATRAAAASAAPAMAGVAARSASLLSTARRLAPALAVAVAGIWAAKKAWSALAGTKAPQLKVPKVSGGGGGLGGSITGGAIGFGIGATIVGAVKGAARIIKGTVGGALGAAVDDESLKVRMDVLVGDPGKADKIISDLKASAANTPLEFGDLSSAATQLIAFGEATDQVNATLLRVGDVATGVKAPLGEIAEIYGKARVQGTLFAEDINQLTGRGIPVIGEFAKQLGVSESEVKKLASEGKVSFPMLEQAFRSLTAEGGRFHGMMATQSQTVEGKLSTIRDAVMENYRAFGAPIMDAMKPVLDQAIALITAMKGKAGEIGKTVAGAITAIHHAVNILSKMDFGSMVKALALPLRIAFKEAANVLWSGIVGIGAVLSSILGSVGTTLGAILKAVITLVTTGLLAAFLQVANSFVATLLGGIHSAIAEVIKNIPGAKAVLGGLAEKTKGMATGAENRAKENEADGINATLGIGNAFKVTGFDPSALGKTFADASKGASQTFDSSGDLASLVGLVHKVRMTMANATKPVASPVGTGDSAGTGDTGKGGMSLPQSAGRLAGALATITGKSAGSVLQEKANSILQTIADNTAPKTTPTEPYRSPSKAWGRGVFS